LSFQQAVINSLNTWGHVVGIVNFTFWYATIEITRSGERPKKGA
jgi:hypothetical protein